jgi:hypothetical protein
MPRNYVLIIISLILKLSVIKSISKNKKIKEIKNKIKTMFFSWNKRCKTWISVTEKHL